MARTVGIGIQSFEKLIMENSFYIDKTDFIRLWWENRDDVTLIREDFEHEYVREISLDRIYRPGRGF